VSAYYNEHDPFAAAWLRELIKAGHIAPGIVDERSIEDVRPDELLGYTQCHFFAGIGVWSYALRQAGWPDSRPVWTGSCPCQPFSAAGKGTGFADERHLWPAWFHLIEHGKPESVPIFGEQVASKDGLAWFDLVQTDLEGAGYACGQIDLCAAGIGAPHIRQRLWFVATRLGDPLDAGLEGFAGHGNKSRESGRERTDAAGSITETGSVCGLADPSISGRNQRREGQPKTWNDGVTGNGRLIEKTRAHDRLADPERDGREMAIQQSGNGNETDGEREADGSGGNRTPSHPGPTNGFWRNADWLYCRDGKWRAVRSGSFPLADRPPARVGRLRGYGNAINAEAAKEFIKAYMETI